MPKGKDKEILSGNSVVLDGMTVPLNYAKNWISKDSRIKYNSDSLNPTVQPEVSTLYMLVTTSPAAHCKDTGTITVNVLMLIDAPNVFSPNGDGLNDTWELKGFESYSNGTVKVFNRYGVAVYETNDYKTSQAWNGTSNGAELPVGTYYYVLEPNIAGLKAMTGFVVLLR